MTASMTITITEDASPHGGVAVDFEIEGFEIENARTNGDLPPALLLGAAMMQSLDDAERDGVLESHGGRPAPSKFARTPTRRRISG